MLVPQGELVVAGTATNHSTMLDVLKLAEGVLERFCFFADAVHLPNFQRPPCRDSLVTSKPQRIGRPVFGFN